MSHPNDYDMVVAQNLTLATCGAEEQFQREVPEIVDAMLQQELGKRDPGPIKVTITVTIDKRTEGVIIGTKCSTKLPAFASKAKVGHITRDNGLRVMTERVEQSTLDFQDRKLETSDMQERRVAVDDDPTIN